ncbi:origin of replication complex subunit 3 [Quercus suber]|uniref:Origin of replication complex subunit 3 n=1 Tax=Quercus suber TaxID=58331 RepID=A0AAW0M3F1_QUESU
MRNPKNAMNNISSRTCIWKLLSLFGRKYSTIKDVLRGINTNIFDEIHSWVCESFNTIKSFGTPGIAGATWAFPIVTDASSKLLFMDLVLTNDDKADDELVGDEEGWTFVTYRLRKQRNPKPHVPYKKREL